MDDKKLLNKLNRKYKQTGGGGIPFSALQKKLTKKKTIRKKKKNSHSKKNKNKNKNKNNQTLRNKKCPCGHLKYTGKEKTPKGLGFCEQCIPLNVIIKGKDGNLYENKNYQWIKI